MKSSIYRERKLRGATLIGTFLLAVSAPAIAEPTDRWWSGWGMGVSEYGWSGSDGSNIYITCDSDGALGLNVAIRGIDPKPNTDVIFNLNGQEVRFWTTADGEIEMKSRVSMNNLYFLFDELRQGSTMFLRFDGLAKEFSLAGSAKGLGEGLCE